MDIYTTLPTGRDLATLSGEARQVRHALILPPNGLGQLGDTNGNFEFRFTNHYPMQKLVEEDVYLQKIRKSIQVISELEVERLRLVHVFSVTNQLIAESQSNLPPAFQVSEHTPIARTTAPTASPGVDNQDCSRHGQTRSVEFGHCFHRCA